MEKLFSFSSLNYKTETNVSQAGGMCWNLCGGTWKVGCQGGNLTEEELNDEIFSWLTAVR